MKELQAQKYAENIINAFGDSGVPCGIKNIKQMIANGYASGYTAHEQSMWRSVEEELPKDDETVLTYSSYGHVLAYYSEQDKMWFAYGCYGDIKPTHWMPIPPLSLPKTNTDKK